MATSQMNNFTTLIKRLEAATSRLEDMAISLETSGSSFDASKAVPSPPQPKPNVSEAPVPPLLPAAPAVPAVRTIPRTVEDFDEVIEDKVKPFVTTAQKLGEPVAVQAKAILGAFKAERTYLYVAAKAKKPDSQPPELLADLRKASEEINNIRESNRPSPFFNHLSAVAEGVVALGWFFESRPADYVKEILGGTQFYGNRVLQEYKGKDDSEVHIHLIQAYYTIFTALISYIQKHYVGGLTWNNHSGVDVITALKEVQSGDSQSTAAAPPPPGPPPPPPPPLPTFDLSKGPPHPQAKPSGSDMTAVFEQLNQGSAITSGLRKVDKSQMTHKNPNLRSSSIVPAGSSAQRETSRPPSKKPKPESMRMKKPPTKRKEGNKWLIDNFENSEEIIEIDAELSSSILISHCNKTIIKVNNKANAVAIDNCKNLSIIVDTLVSSIEVIKSPKFALQIDGVVPTILLDQVDGATVYLSKQSLASEIFTSKASNINITLPPQNEEEDSKECPVPEQIRTVVKNNALISEVVEHAG